MTTTSTEDRVIPVAYLRRNATLAQRINAAHYDVLFCEQEVTDARQAVRDLATQQSVSWLSYCKANLRTAQAALAALQAKRSAR
jgi:hypothetical protein